MLEGSRKPICKCGVSASLALPCLTPGRQHGNSRGNHKPTQLLRISKCPKDEVGSFKALARHYFITYGQAYLGIITIITLQKVSSQIR